MSLLNSSDKQYYFDAIDGWGGNLESGGVISDSIVPASVHTYAPAGTSPLKRGAIVMSTHDGVQPTCTIPLVDADVSLDSDKRPPHRFWMVVEGNTEYEYSSHMGDNKVVALRGSFAVETAHVKGVLNVGDEVTAEHGTAGSVDALLPHQTTGGGAPGVNEGRLMKAASGDPIIGYVVNKKSLDGVDVYTVELNF